MSYSLRGASPLGLPHTLPREPLRRLAPFAWLAFAALARLLTRRLARGRPGSYNAFLRASNGSDTFWLNVGNGNLASGGPAGFLEGDRGLPQPQCSDALSLGEGRGLTRSPATTQGTRLGVRVQERAGRLGQRAK